MSVSGPSRRYHRRTYLVAIGAIADMPGARARRCLRSLTACFAVYSAGTQPFKPLRSFHAGQRRDSLGNVQILLASEGTRIESCTIAVRGNRNDGFVALNVWKSDEKA